MSARGGGEANKATGLLYYRTDTARLCLSCDQEVHATNTLFRKYAQSLLCDGCHSAPASILCDSERSALCHDCNWDRHCSADADPHHSHRPSSSELPRILDFDYLGWEKPGEEDDRLWETARAVGFDNLVVLGFDVGFWVMAYLVYFWV